MNSCLQLILDGFLSSADIENTDDIIINEVALISVLMKELSTADISIEVAIYV